MMIQSEERIVAAHNHVCASMLMDGLSDAQLGVLTGMSAALSWVRCRGDALDRMLAGEPIAAGQTDGLATVKRAIRDTKRGDGDMNRVLRGSE